MPDLSPYVPDFANIEAQIVALGVDDGRMNWEAIFDDSEAGKAHFTMPAAFPSVGPADYQDPQTWGQIVQEGTLSVEIIVVGDGMRANADRTDAYTGLQIALDILEGAEIIDGMNASKLYARRIDAWQSEGNTGLAGYRLQMAMQTHLISKHS